MELKSLMLAEYATIGQDGKLSICGIIDSFTATIPHDAELPDGAIPLPKMYLVAVVECSIAEGTRHHAKIRMVNGEGKPIGEFLELGEWNFIVNPHGVPMRFHAVVQMVGLAIPELGEANFELHVDDKRLGETTLNFNVTRADPPS